MNPPFIDFIKNPKFNLRPILDVIEKNILPIKKDIEWGYHIPYMISGALNLHPEDAIEQMSLSKDASNKLSFKDFYDKCLDIT